MSNTHENLTSLFSDIADAIREKTGDSNTLVADNFPTAILEIPASSSSNIIQLEKTHENYGNGYVYNGNFLIEDYEGDASDIYAVNQNHLYIIGLGSIVSNRYRVMFSEIDPYGRDVQTNGTSIGADNNNPSSYVMSPVFTAPSSGFVTIFKAYDGTGPNILSYILDVTEVFGGEL